jgi:hypothetical protein
MATTLLQLRDDVRTLVDDTAELLINDADLTRVINRSGRAWHTMVVQAMPHLFETSETLTPNGSTLISALPVNHYKTIGVMYNESSTKDEPLEHLQANERWKIDRVASTRGYYYELINGNTYILPAPATGTKTYTHYYIKGWTMLSGDSDNVMGWGATLPLLVDGLVDWIVYDAAIQVKIKEGTPTHELERKRENVQHQLDVASSAHDAGHPHRVEKHRRVGVGYSYYDPDFWTNR